MKATDGIVLRVFQREDQPLAEKTPTKRQGSGESTRGLRLRSSLRDAMKHEKEPLYRRVNTKALRCTHKRGGDFRHARNTKRLATSDDKRGRMQGRSDRGLDYTPLFRFLLSKVGMRWDEVHAEAVARLDREAPIYWLVARCEEDKQARVRVGESTYFSGLFVDADGLLQRVDEGLSVASLTPSCACCTHTFNGVPFVRKFEAS